MITPEIVSYVQKERSKKKTDEAIKAELLTGGWGQADIDEAFSATPSVVSLKKFQRDRMWVIFSVWIALGFIWLAISSLGTGFGVSSGYFILGYFVTVLLSSYVSSLGAVPHNKEWKNVADLIIRIIATGALILIIGFALLFVSCLVLLSSSGSRI